MSLYTDEDIELYGAEPAVGVVAAPTDPLQALSAALGAAPESPQQAELLLAAGSRFEEHPEKLPDLCTKLLRMVVDGGDSLLRAWALDMLALTVGRSGLSGEIKLEVAQQSLESLNHLLQGRSVSTIRAIIPIFSTVYSMLFRSLATSGAAGAGLNRVFQESKSRILSLVLDPTAQPQSVGIKAAAWKFVQKVLLVGTRASGGDPRLLARSNDVSVALIGPGSPLQAHQLEEEATLLRTQLVTQLYAFDDPALLHPIINIFPPLVKMRPSLAPLIVSSMASWSPAAMEAARRPPMQIRAVEKTLRAVMAHIANHPPLVGFSAQLREALIHQKQRMEIAYATAAEETRMRRAKAAATKHPLEADAESSAGAAKRARLEVLPGTGSGRGNNMVDVSVFGLEPVIEAVMAGLSAVSDDLLTKAFENARAAILDDAPGALHVLAPSLFKDGIKAEEEEIVNPLDMELDDEELLMEPIEQELDEPVTIADFRLPPPEPLPVDEKNGLVDYAVRRIWDTGADLSHLADLQISDAPRSAVQPKEMWMLLLARLSSRGSEDKRRVIGEFVAKDFGVRSKFATVWLNEEWLAKRRDRENQYEAGLMAILNAYIPTVDSKDQSLSQFLLGLPELPDAALDALVPPCEDPDRMIVGFISLRELAEGRPPVRAAALNTLLQFCTHPERRVRVMAITTVRRWVPNSPMSGPVIAYALGVLARLIEPDQAGDDVPEPAESKYLGVVDSTTVSQHVELAFALSRRDQDLLDNIFNLYPKLPSAIQDTVEAMLVPLIKSLGPTPKLLEILRNAPPGADKLALRVVTTLSAEGSSPVLVGVIRTLMKERELDPRFIIPVIGELDKDEIESQLPGIVNLLDQPADEVKAEPKAEVKTEVETEVKAENGEEVKTEEEKAAVKKEADAKAAAARKAQDAVDVVRTAFASALQKMTPADLLVSLHSEKASKIATRDAIKICFTMTTVFRSDVLANAMQRIVDQPGPLPVFFVRTVIQAVKTYKSLVPFIANKILPKLVARKVWEMPQLWGGFVLVLRMLGQSSFGALLQMPVEQIKDVIEQQPALKAPLKTYVSGKPAARAQLAQIFGDD